MEFAHKLFSTRGGTLALAGLTALIAKEPKEIVNVIHIPNPRRSELQVKLAELEANLEGARAELESAIKSNQVRLEFGVRRYDRTVEVFRKDLVPLKEMDEAETAKILADLGLLEAHENRRMAELELQRATVAVGLRTIRSPVRGVVTERVLSAGEFAGQAPILKVARIDPLRVEVFVPVALFGKVAVGMRAHVMPESPVGGARIAEVTIVDRVIDAASGTFGVRLALPNRDLRLPAGLKCKVRFVRD